MRTVSIKEIRNAIKIGVGDELPHDSAEILETVHAVLDKIEVALEDRAPFGTRALWTSLGYHAEITWKNERWVMRAFPGGFSVKHVESGKFHMSEADSMQEAMLAAEAHIMGKDLAVPQLPGAH